MLTQQVWSLRVATKFQRRYVIRVHQLVEAWGGMPGCHVPARRRLADARDL